MNSQPVACDILLKRLRSFGFLSGLNEGTLTRLADTATWKVFSPDTVIFWEGVLNSSPDRREQALKFFDNVITLIRYLCLSSYFARQTVGKPGSMFFTTKHAKHKSRKELVATLYITMLVKFLTSGISTGQEDRLLITTPPLRVITYFVVLMVLLTRHTEPITQYHKFIAPTVYNVGAILLCQTHLNNTGM